MIDDWDEDFSNEDQLVYHCSAGFTVFVVGFKGFCDDCYAVSFGFASFDLCSCVFVTMVVYKERIESVRSHCLSGSFRLEYVFVRSQLDLQSVY